MIRERKESLALKIVTSLEDDKDKLESLDDLEEDEYPTFLTKKYQKILRLKRVEIEKDPFLKEKLKQRRLTKLITLY